MFVIVEEIIDIERPDKQDYEIYTIKHDENKIAKVYMHIFEPQLRVGDEVYINEKEI
jgi:hypothetical protein